MRRVGTVTDGSGAEHAYDVERVTIEPFDLRDQPSYDLVIDRLAYWYYVPREWLKKVALMDGVYLMNSPFTFQAMEKHAAYCAMMRLGLKVPDTALVPYKNPVDHAKYAYTGAALQPALRPRRDRRQDRLPAVHEALRRRCLARRLAHPQRRRAAPRLRRVRRDADAPAGLRGGLRRLRPVAVDRRRDDGDALRPRPADARALLRRPRLPLPRGRRRGPDDRADRQLVLPLGVQLLRDAGRRTGRSTRSTTPTPARTWRSRRCTTTSPGR